MNWNDKQAVKEYYQLYRKNNRDKMNVISLKYKKKNRKLIAFKNKEYRNRLILKGC